MKYIKCLEKFIKYLLANNISHYVNAVKFNFLNFIIDIVKKKYK